MGVRGRRNLSDAAYRELFGKIREGFFIGELVFDQMGGPVDFRFLELNEAFLVQTGLAESAVLGMRAREAIPGFPDELIECFAQVVQTGTPASREYQVPALAHRWYGVRAHAVDEHRFVVLLFDISQRKRIEVALQESERLLGDIVETMDQLVWSARPDGFHDFFNRRWYEFTGTSPGEDHGYEWLQLFHPDDRARINELWQHSVATGEVYEIEYRLRHHLLGYRWVLGRAHPVRNDEGKIIRWMGTCTDIHEQKEVAEQFELAGNELSHRIKNIFAVISALISLSLPEHPEAKEFADELRDRLASLGKAHDYARPHGKGSAPTAQPATVLGLIRQLLQPYRIEGRERVVIEGDDGPLNPDASTPLSLAVHELATNSAKYGAFNTPGGQVRVEGWRSNGTYGLRWTERGGPEVSEPTRFGFGSRLVEASLQSRLHGKLVREWQPEGLVVSLSAPAEQILASE
jgi:PAS domain S-box-containing protein